MKKDEIGHSRPLILVGVSFMQTAFFLLNDLIIFFKKQKHKYQKQLTKPQKEAKIIILEK